MSGERGRGRLFIERRQRPNQEAQSLFDGVDEDQVGEKGGQDGNQRQSRGLRWTPRGLQVGLQTPHKLGVERGQVPQGSVRPPCPVHGRVGRWKEGNTREPNLLRGAFRCGRSELLHLICC